MVLIIGGGIIGLSIAWRLAQARMNTTVVDAGNRGGEASPAGAGMLAPGGEFDRRSVWTDLSLESQAAYGDFVTELRAASGLEIDYSVCGGLELAFSEDQMRSLRERAARQAQFGIVSEERPEGLFYPMDAYVDSRQVLDALRVACRRRGAVLYQDRLAGAAEASDFAAVVVAAGAWSGSIILTSEGVPLPLPKSIPVKGHLVGYDLQPGALGPIRRHGHTYMLQRASGFLIAGSTEERIGFDTTVDARICQEIHGRAVALWPALGTHKPSQCWTGLRPATEDLMPRIGQFENTNVWLAYGHYRNGILLAPVTAARVSREIIAHLASSGKG